jgi:hypothetical protein
MRAARRFADPIRFWSVRKWHGTTAVPSPTRRRPTGGLEHLTIGAGATSGRHDEHPGSFPYHCGIHPSMTGTLVVVIREGPLRYLHVLSATALAGQLLMATAALAASSGPTPTARRRYVQDL